MPLKNLNSRDSEHASQDGNPEKTKKTTTVELPGHKDGKAVTQAKICKAVRDDGKGKCVFWVTDGKRCSLTRKQCAEVTIRKGNRIDAAKDASLALSKLKNTNPAQLEHDDNMRLVISSTLETMIGLEDVNFEMHINDPRFGELKVVPKLKPDGSKQLTIRQFSHLAAALSAFPGAHVSTLEVDTQPLADKGTCARHDCDKPVGTTTEGRKMCKDGHEQA